MSQSALFSQPNRITSTSRKTMFCAIVLSLLTGLVAGQLWAPSRPNFGPPASVPSAKTALLAGDYYLAVNRYLQGDQLGRLEALIGPDYIGHLVENAADENRDELLASLDGVKRIFPLIQMDAEVISADNRLVVVRVAMERTSGGILAGIAIETTEAPSEIEVLRFEGDTLIERWSHVQWPATFDQHGTVQHTIIEASSLQPRLERVILGADGQMELAFGTAFLIETEVGELEIQGRQWGAPSSTEQPANSAVHLVGTEAVTLREGELALAARHGPFTIRAIGGESATFLLFRLESPVRESQSPPLPSESAPTQGTMAEVRTLATGRAVISDQKPWAVSIGRVTLASGTMLAPHQIEGVEIVVVESGELRTVVGACTTTRCIATVEGSSQFVSGETLLREGDGFSTAQSATVTYEAGPTGQVTFLMITVARPRAEQVYS